MKRELEARAVISAVDRTGATFDRVAEKIRRVQAAAETVGGVSGSLVSLGKRVEDTGRKLSTFGRNFSTGFTLPAALVARNAYGTVHDFELAANKLKAFGELSEDELKRAKRIAQEYGSRYQFGPVGVMKGMVEQIKAGFSPQALEALQQPILDFATMAEIDIPRASELAVFALAGFGRMYDQTGRLLEGAALNKNLREMVDLFGILNKVAPGSIEGIADTFKYSAPIARQMNVSPEQLGAFTAVLAQAGILGSESGVALRSMMVRFLKPTRGSIAAMNAAGLSFGDYINRDLSLLTPERMLDAIETSNGKLAADKRAALVKRLRDLDKLEGDDFFSGLTAAIASLGDGSQKDAEASQKLASRIVGSAVQGLDIIGFLRDVAKVPNPAALMANVMDQRQGARLANLEFPRIATMLEDMVKEMRAARERGTSVSSEMAGTINSGIIAAENRLRGSYQNLWTTLGDTGVIESAAKAMDAMSSSLRALADVNPKILELGTYAVAAGAAIGPLALVLGKLATGAGTVLRLMGYVAGAGAAGAAGASAIGGSAAGSAAVAALPPWLAWRDTIGTIDRIRENEDELMRRGLMPANRSFPEAGMGPLTLDSVRSALGMTPIKAELTGEATVKLDVSVKPDPGFWASVKSTVANTINNFRLLPPAGSTGSTGQSMPEVGPMP